MQEKGGIKEWMNVFYAPLVYSHAEVLDHRDVFGQRCIWPCNRAEHLSLELVSRAAAGTPLPLPCSILFEYSYQINVCTVLFISGPHCCWMQWIPSPLPHHVSESASVLAVRQGQIIWEWTACVIYTISWKGPSLGLCQRAYYSKEICLHIDYPQIKFWCDTFWHPIWFLGFSQAYLKT